MMQEFGAYMNRFNEGFHIFNAGDTSQEKIFLLVNGSVDLFRSGENTGPVLRTVHAGEFFGEMGGITGNLRTITAVVSSQTAEILVLSKEQFLTAVGKNPEFGLELNRNANKRYLQALVTLAESLAAGEHNVNLLSLPASVDIRRDLSISDFVSGLPVNSYFKGDRISESSDGVAHQLSWITYGKAEMSMELSGKSIFKRRLSKGQFFGAMAMLGGTGKIRQKVVALTPRVRVSYLTEERFTELCERNPVFAYSVLKILLEGAESIESQINDLGPNRK